MSKINVAVLMSTYNGERWIKQQIDSILDQEGVCSWIYVRDDGSSDNTMSVIEEYTEKARVHIFDRNDIENLGAGDSFMELVKYAQNELANRFTYFAFADQDDFWMPDKLISAIGQMQGIEDPCLYFSKKTIVDSELVPTAVEDYMPYSDLLLHCMGQSNASGCTFVFNRQLLIKVQDKVKGRGYHDAWLFRLSVWCGFKVIFDEQSHILYRQHDKNTMGAIRKKIWYRQILIPETWKHQVDRFLNRNLNDVVLMQRDIYNKYSAIFPNSNMEILKLIVNYRYSIHDRYKLMRQSVFKRNGKRDYVKWMLKIAMNRV